MTNLPRVGGRYATLLDHIDDFVCGFSEYAMFLSLRARKSGREALFDGFVGLPVPPGHPTHAVLRPAPAPSQKRPHNGGRSAVVGAG